MIRSFIRTIKFAMSAQPSEAERENARQLIQEQDDLRAKGVMSSLSRNNMLLRLEEVSELKQKDKV